MNAYHDSREDKFRTPFGAVKAGTELTLRIDIWDGVPTEATLRVWAEGVGELRIPMELRQRDGGFTAVCKFTPEVTGLCWYRLELRADDGTLSYYGAKEGRQGGIGQLYPGDSDCPSYQITVFNERRLPKWYKEGIVYQIFPDRFAREGRDHEEQTLSVRLKGHTYGPKRRIVPWDKPVGYEKNPDGSMAAWDFYGGSLRGISSKLSYLKSLGISIIYLNPIFEAASSHRYDTGDYMTIDPLLGTEEDFRELCTKADKLGISVILDGVFNHTGCDSIYFNKYGNYESLGAYQSEASPYRSWYSFNNDTKDGYDSWWGVGDLPSLRESEQDLRDFILGVVRKWLIAGAKGWRLDVADELPDDFIAEIKQTIEEKLGAEGLLLGEVWEDASNKESYGVRRQYLEGKELDCVMNYPFRDGVCGFLTGDLDAEELAESMYTLLENYPKEVFYGAFNLLGSHDKERILTVLGARPNVSDLSESEKAAYKLSDSERGLAKARLWLGALLQMTMPGVPSIYYGDEAGMEGYADPYNRAPYPWGSADADCMSIYRNAIGIRQSHRVFVEGDFKPFALDEEVYGFTRSFGDEAVTVLINRSLESEKDIEIPCLGEYASDIISGRLYYNCSTAAEDNKASDTGLEDAEGKDSDKSRELQSKLTVHLNRLGSAVIYFAPSGRLGKKLDAGNGVLCHITSLPGNAAGKTDRITSSSSNTTCQMSHAAGLPGDTSGPVSAAGQSESCLTKASGTIGSECFRFIDYLKSRGDKYWQILPLNPTDAEGSPYAGSSAFAGNPRLLPFSEEELRAQYAAFIKSRQDNDDYKQFAANNAEWLDGYAMYQAIKLRMHNKPYSEWNEGYRSCSAKLWEDAALSCEADYYRFEQYVFETEWRKVRAYAREQGIKIIGDMPIYVSTDSADAWEYPEYFKLDEEAGVPPDYFSEDGQTWGNPLYRWDVLKADNYRWWMNRFKRAFALYDVVRLDHFRGFEAYWAIPRGEKAGKGHWMPGPGRDLFDEACRQFGPLPIIAEDLGFITPGVRMLIASTGFPGMDVMQFSDTNPREAYSPYADRVSYTGTHDNETLPGWCRNRYREDIEKNLKLKSINEGAEAYQEAFEAEANAIAESLLKSFYDTEALIKIVPLQDILGLGNEARMNTPGTVGQNWSWQLTPEQFNTFICL